MRKIYAVRQGRQTGLFNTWAACEAQVKGYAGARYKGFTDAAAAMAMIPAGSSLYCSCSAVADVETTAVAADVR